MKLVIHGQTPAQKNGKSVGTVKATGRTFVASSKIVKAWQKTALVELNLQDVKMPRDKRIRIDYMFYVKDNLQRDTDNMIASVNDMLQLAGSDYEWVTNKKGVRKWKPIKKTGIIVGDHWQVLKLGDSDVEIDKENPRAELLITVLE
jgi:Holliday junction resolvase RusA-like endonuclease